LATTVSEPSQVSVPIGSHLSADAAAVDNDKTCRYRRSNRHPAGVGCRDYGWTPTMSTMPTIRLPGGTT
jgi:hypothetical protein